MKTKIFLLLILIPLILNAQKYEAQKIGCVKYVYKTVSIKERENKPLFVRNYKKNPFVMVISAIRNKGLLVYRADNGEGNEFSEYISEKEIYETMNLEPYNSKGVFKQKKINFRQVNAYKILEAHIYGKSGELLAIRPVGFAPATQKVDALRLYFWVKFEDFENIAEKGFNSKDCPSCFPVGFFYNTKYKGKIIGEYQVNFRQYEVPYIKGTEGVLKKTFVFLPVNQDRVKYARLRYFEINDSVIKNKYIFDPKEKKFGYVNLISLIYEAVHRGELNVYKVFAGDLGTGMEFSEKMNENEFYERLRINPRENLDFSKVKGFLLIYLELFDYKDSLYLSVPLAIGPEVFDNGKYLAGLIYYPELAKYTARQYVMTDSCEELYTFDDLFVRHLFKAKNFADKNYWRKIMDTTLINEINENSEYFSKTYVDLKQYWRILPYPKPVKIHFSYPLRIYKYPQVKNFSRAQTVYTKISKEQNPELFYPYNPERGYMNLMALILYQIGYYGHLAYKNENFSEIITENEIYEKLTSEIFKIELEGDNGNLTILQKDVSGIDFSEIDAFIAKELWLYDDHGNIIQKRILALAPVRRYFAASDVDKKTPLYIKLFWIRFDDYLPVFQRYNITKLTPVRDKSFAEYFVNIYYKPQIIEVKEISKSKALKSINK